VIVGTYNLILVSLTNGLVNKKIETGKAAIWLFVEGSLCLVVFGWECKYSEWQV